MANNSGLIVQRGDSSFLSSQNLTIKTNLNAFGSDITYSLIQPPSAGIILKDNAPIFSFTSHDIHDECIEYRHNNSHDSKDEMQLEISARDDKNHIAKTKIYFVFHVYPESYWEPLAIASNNSILVEESTSIAITKHDLQVESRAEMSSKDIIYEVNCLSINQEIGGRGHITVFCYQPSQTVRGIGHIYTANIYSHIVI